MVSLVKFRVFLFRVYLEFNKKADISIFNFINFKLALVQTNKFLTQIY